MENETKLGTYSGGDPYAFISFSIFDEDEAKPFIERLQSDGDRVSFYFEEESEPFPEAVTERISNCSCFIALVSQEYFQLSEYSDELTLAHDLGKPIFLVYLEATTVPADMREITQPLQSVNKYQLKNENALFKRLYRFKPLKACFDKNAKKAAKQAKQPDPNDYINLRFLPSDDRALVKDMSRTFYPEDLLDWAENAADKDDFEAAEYFYLAAAVQGDVDAYYSLGTFYEDNLEFDKALYWFSKGVEAGDSPSVNRIGVLYYEKIRDYKKAEEWWLKAAENGDKMAEFNLGLLYHKVYYDFETAEKWYLRSAKQGFQDALLNLGTIYFQNFMDFEKAEEWFLKAAQNDNVDAMYSLGFVYAFGMSDYRKSVIWFMKAAKRGDVHAMIDAGVLFFTQKEYKNAERMWLKALKVDPQNTAALYNLGVLYDEVWKDYNKAKKYFLYSAKIGDQFSMMRLSELYFTAFQDIKKSKKWLRRAKEAGFDRPIENFLNNSLKLS